MQIIETKKLICKCGSGQVYTKQKGTILVCRLCGKEEDISNNKDIYFAHPKDIYNTEYELNCIIKIKDLYPDCKIINPRNIKLAEEDKNPKGYTGFMKQMEKYYFSAIITCGLVIVAKTGSGKISPGVQKEIKFALTNGIKVEYLDVPFPEDNWPTFPSYRILETGLGFRGEDGDNAEEIDIEEAITLLNEHGTEATTHTIENGVNYTIIEYIDGDENCYSTSGLMISEVLLNYIKKKGYIKKEDKTKCRTCGSTDITRVENSSEWRCNKCGNNIIQCWTCQDGTYASYVRDDEEHAEVICKDCAIDMIDFDEKGEIDHDNSQMNWRKITGEEFRSGKINWSNF